MPLLDVKGLSRLRRPKPQTSQTDCFPTRVLAQLRRSPWAVLVLQLTVGTCTLEVRMTTQMLVNVLRPPGLR